MEVFLSEKQVIKKKLVEKSLPIKVIKVVISASMASSIPPLGPLLGQYGINIAEFCKEFNEDSLVFEKETLLPIIIYLGQNKQFYFEYKLLSVSYLIRKYMESIESDSLLIKKRECLKMCYEIAYYRAFIFYKDNVEISEFYMKSFVSCILGTLRSFGYKIIE